MLFFGGKIIKEALPEHLSPREGEDLASLGGALYADGARMEFTVIKFQNSRYVELMEVTQREESRSIPHAGGITK